MTGIEGLRCLNHTEREAAARCLECNRVFCRECVTEFEHRVICASCLKKLAGSHPARLSRLSGFSRLGQCLLAIFFLWLVFYSLGQALLRTPDSFHEGTLWQTPWWMEE